MDMLSHLTCKLFFLQSVFHSDADVVAYLCLNTVLCTPNTLKQLFLFFFVVMNFVHNVSTDKDLVCYIILVTNLNGSYLKTVINNRSRLLCFAQNLKFILSLYSVMYACFS